MSGMLLRSISPHSRNVLLYKSIQLQPVRFGGGGSMWESNNWDYGGLMKQQMKNSPKTAKLWKKVFFFVMVPGLCIAAWMGYTDHQRELEHIKHGLTYVEYPYLGRRNKPFPWGDGNHSLLHNPYTNWVPGVGYEKSYSDEDH